MEVEQPPMALEDHLKKWFGYNTFRSHQKDVVEGILQGKDVLAILPTGAGKSLCYQLPAMLYSGTAVVISPLISLMQDQVSALTKSGIRAAYINSSLPLPELSEVLRNLKDYKLLYIAPERFADPNFLERLKALPLSFFVIDEAHCISQWGHSFRPDYRQLSIIKKSFPSIPLMALTATATQEVENDIMAQLTMQAPLIAKGSFDRPNLMIRINGKSDPYRQVVKFLEQHKNQSGIIYASTRKVVDSLYEDLHKANYNVGKYHAGLRDQERQVALHDFIHDKTQLMIATVAFGMGINKPDVRFIIHHDMPRSIEQYYQEIGRAGRDGLPAECLMLYSGQDLMIYKHFMKEITDPIQLEATESKTAAIYSLCRSMKCRRKGLLSYFGETYPQQECTGCDNCVDEVEKVDGLIIAQKILSCVYRLKENFGIRHVIDVLRGSKNQNILSRGHETLSTYGLMGECSEPEVRYYIDSLLMMGFLETSQGEYPVLKWTVTSRGVITGKVKVEFRKKIFKEKAIEAPTIAYSHTLFNKLRDLRLEIARRESLPPFAVFADRSLLEMATYLPQTEHDFLSINGVGRFKLENYGEHFIAAIRHYCQENNIQPQVKKSLVAIPKNVIRAQPQSAVISRLQSASESMKLFQEGKSLDQIALHRNLSKGTIIGHLVDLIEDGQNIDIDGLVAKETQEAINSMIDQVGMERLAPLKAQLPEPINYDEIRFVVAKRRASSKHN